MGISFSGSDFIIFDNRIKKVWLRREEPQDRKYLFDLFFNMEMEDGSIFSEMVGKEDVHFKYTISNANDYLKSLS